MRLLPFWLGSLLLCLLFGCGPSPNDKQDAEPFPVATPAMVPVAGNGQAGPYPGDAQVAVETALQPLGPLAVGLNNTLAFADREALRLVPATFGSYYGAERLAGRLYTLPLIAGGIRSLAIEPQTSHLLIGSPDRLWLLPQRAGSFWGQNVNPGQLTLLAGGGTGLDEVPGSAANLGGLNDISLTPEGHVLIAAGCRVLLLAGQSPDYQGRAVQPGRVYTIAGAAAGDGCGSAPEGTPAREASLGRINAVVGDAAGSLIFAEARDGGGQLRMVPRREGDFFGRSMTAGRVFIIAGGGTFVARDVGARTAKLPLLSDLALGPRGQLVAASAGSPSLFVMGAEPGRFGGVQLKTGNIYEIGGTTAFPLRPATGLAFNSAGWLYLSTAARILVLEP